MSRTDVVDLSHLPAGFIALLDEFRQAFDEPDVRVLADLGNGTVCLYPEGAAGTDGHQSHTAIVATPDGAALQLEVCNGRATAADVRFLGHALTRVYAHEREARTAARELTERYEEINLLYMISEILGSVLSVRDAATRILGEVADVLGARRASLWVYRPEEDMLHLAAAVGEDGLSGPIPAADEDSATAWVFRSKQSLNLERGVALPSGSRRLEPRPMGREAFLSVPINYTPPDGGQRTVGVITLVGRRSDVRFTAGDARLLAAIASQIGAALETQRLVQESLRQERMVRELELAHDLQLKLLPDPAAFEGTLAVSARCVPAESVGGDFYQLFRLPGDRLGIMVGDVSSHGFPAALIMALVMSAVGIYAPESGAPGEVLRRVHRAIADELESTEMYLSLFYGVIDAGERTITYANAGHPQAFRIRADEGCETRLGATGTPLGMLPEGNYGEAIAPWAPGDVLLVYTDGLSDAFGEERGSREGEEALVRFVAERRGAPLGDILDQAFRVTDARPGLAPDDRTMLLVRG